MGPVSTKSIVEKFHLKPGQILVVIDAPDGYVSLLGVLPHGCRLESVMRSDASVVQIFVTDTAMLRARLDGIRSELGTAVLWVTYPKGGSGIRTDLNRDIIWAYVRTIGFDAVSNISVDEVWSALRLKAIAPVKD
jgi:hypothetical protein